MCPAAGAAGVTLRVSAPQTYQVIQRGGDGRADIVVRGVSKGLGARVQASWAGRPWTTASVGRGGAFTVRLRDCPGGQGTLRVRAAARPSVARSVRYVGVGDIFVVAGQSNASGRAYAASSYSGRVRASMFGNDDLWKALRDPVDSPARQVDRVSADPRAGGSVWPLVGAGLVAADPVPVAFVPCARATTSISRWLRDEQRPYSRATLYGSMVRRVRAVGGRVRAVLFWQGEADARALVERSRYQVSLALLASQLGEDCGAPLVAAQIGDYGPRYAAEAVNGIRLAQQDAWSAGWALPGPVLYDIDLHGDVHFRREPETALAAARWTAAILAGVEGSDAPAGPTLLEATYDGVQTIALRFDCHGEQLRQTALGGFFVGAADGDPVDFAYAAVTAPETVSVFLLAPTTEPLRVSLGSGREGAGRPVPRETSAWGLPALPFVDVPVEMPAAAGPAGSGRGARP